MAMNSPDIQQGMDVYGSNGDKIGTVANTFSGGGTTSDTTTGRGATGGGVGALGTESVVDQMPGAGGGVGSLGDESAVGGMPGAGGGTGVLGDESSVAARPGGGAGALGAGSAGGQAGGGVGSLGDESVVGNSPGVGGGSGTLGDDTSGYSTSGLTPGDVEVEVVEVDVVSDAGSYAGADQNTAPAGYEPNPYEGTPGYFEVDSGGFLGIGTKHLYVPYSAVMNVDPDTGVVLSVTKDDAEQMFATEPAGH